MRETESAIRIQAEKVWKASHENTGGARTVVIKLKTKEFETLTRSLTPSEMPISAEGLVALAVSLLDRVTAESGQLFRLVGVGLSNFRAPQEPPRSASDTAPHLFHQR